MKIPVFVSSPTALNDAQKASREIIFEQLDRQGLEPRALGQFDYPTELPLREVLQIAKHCAGGIILGFEQFQASGGIWKRGTDRERKLRKRTPFPTAWNHLEAGILFGLKLPLLVFREEGIVGGIFDIGVTDVFIHPMPVAPLSASTEAEITAVFRKWQAVVRNHYYS